MRLQWRQILISALVGFALGAVSVAWYLEYRDTGGGEDHYSRMQERFSSRLDLTPEQKQQIGAILEDMRQKVSALRTEIRPRFEEIRRAVREEIRSLLTPEQQKKFDAMQSEWESRRKKHR
jgi:Spy/CpxP family protein refolding chaperone